MDRLKKYNPLSTPSPSYTDASSSSSNTSTATKWKAKASDSVARITGKSTSDEKSEGTRARPITSLRDPTTFAPPPRHRALTAEGRVVEGTRTPPPPPPRLPPRSGSGNSGNSGNEGAGGFPAHRDVEEEEMRRSGGVDVGALGRLKKAGISVPGFGPSSSSSAKTPPPPPPVSSASSRGGAMGGLGMLSSGKAGGEKETAVPSEGTSFADKKKAYKTANSFYKDPKSVSFADAKAAAKTGQNFQARHGEQVAAGYKKANDLGLVQKAGGYADLYARQQQQQQSGGGEQRSASVPPPPPPPSHVASGGGGGGGSLAGVLGKGSNLLQKHMGGLQSSSTKDTPNPPLPVRPASIPPLPARPPSVPPPGLPPRIPSRTNSSEPLLVVGKKKPPPLPPKKKPKPPINDENRGGPPPIPFANRPTLTPRPSTSSTTGSLPNNGCPEQLVPCIPSDLDLSLSTGWFAKSPLRMHHSIENTEERMYSYSTSWSRSASGRTTHTLVIELHYTLNLSKTEINLTWDASAPEATVKCQQRHFPPPPPLSFSELEAEASRYGPQVVAYARSKLGQQVGDGECWTLAHDALVHVSEHSRDGEEPFVSQGVTHGAAVYSHYPSLSLPPSTANPSAVIRPGDILQFRSAHWVTRDSSGRIVYEARAGGAEESSGCKDHTAIVASVENGGRVGVLHQNRGGVKTVGTGEYVLGADMVGGGVRAFRVVGRGRFA